MVAHQAVNKVCIAHLTVVRQLTPGQLKQLRYEYLSITKLEGCCWTTYAFHCGPEIKPYVLCIPRPFQGLLGRKLFKWLVAFFISNKVDHLLLRHDTFDPFALLFAPLIGNRSSVHHAKECAELLLIKPGIKGKLASLLERITGRIVVSTSKAIFGVTHEIAQYECSSHHIKKPICVYSNGILPSEVDVLADQRSTNAVHAAFICGTFSAWHGLEKLFYAAQECCAEDLPCRLVFHLIGRASARQFEQAAEISSDCIRFETYGTMNEAEYIPILQLCDIGIASLALERKGLHEASTLKVREMLAFGLPMYSGHKDLALPEAEDYIKVVNIISINEIVEFGLSAKTLSRKYVRSRSLERIDKAAAMQVVVSFLRSLR